MRKVDNLPTSCAVVTKSGSLNFLEPSGSLRVCNGTALPFTMLLWRLNFMATSRHDQVFIQNCRILLSDLNQNSIFSTDFHKSRPKSNFTDIRPVGASPIHVDRRTDGHGAATRRLSRLNESARNSPHRLQSFNQSQYSSILWTDL